MCETMAAMLNLIRSRQASTRLGSPGAQIAYAVVGAQAIYCLTVWSVVGPQLRAVSDSVVGTINTRFVSWRLAQAPRPCPMYLAESRLFSLVSRTPRPSR